MKKTDVSFYQLTVSPLEKALPQLLEKIYARKLRVHVVVDSPERLAALDHSLWTYSTGAFLPHGSRGEPADQPIWLDLDGENRNQASVLVVTHGLIPEQVSQYERIIDIFDGNLALAEARSRYQTYKDKGNPVQFWEQARDGRWQKAETSA